MANPNTTMKLPLRPDLLLDTKFPTNVAVQLLDLTHRIDLLERFYGVVSNHDDLGNLASDGHSQYALAASEEDRDAVLFLSNKKNRLFIGSGAPFRPQNMNPTKGDYYFRTDAVTTTNQRLYVCTVGGAAPTWVGIL
jgi:hypothetical protein